MFDKFAIRTYHNLDRFDQVWWFCAERARRLPPTDETAARKAMNNAPQNPAITNDPTETAARSRGARRPPRLPSTRATAALAAVMLAVGVAAGAAIGPTPESSFAGDAGTLARRLPLLLAALTGHSEAESAASTTTASTPTPEAGSRRRVRRHRRLRVAATPAASGATPSSSEATSKEPAKPPAGSGGSGKAGGKKLPAVASVWLIQLAGPGFTQALGAASAAPYIDGQLIPRGTLLSGWSAIAGSAFANDTVLAEPIAPGAAPPLLHSIVQPPCAEGAAGAPCAPETPGQLAAADEFLKSTLAQITGTPAYREHGLVVVTFATVGIASQAGLPAGASSATLTSQPPGGVVLLSPFARAGSRLSAAFNPTSPRQSLEALLR
jgi:hypothetical protein